MELIDGERVVTPPASEPHGTKHSELAYLLRAHVAPGYRGAINLLVRAAEDQDFAPDASVFPEARDPVTGGRQLDVLAFEIVGEQELAVATRKARALAVRGVRRVFCIHLDHNEVLEWDRTADGWSWLAPDARIADESLVCALPVAALLDASTADEAVAYALSFRQGELQGRRAQLLSLVRLRFGEPTAEATARVLGAHPDDTEPDIAARRTLLQPITDQQDELAILRARRRGEGPAVRTSSDEAPDDEALDASPAEETPGDEPQVEEAPAPV